MLAAFLRESGAEPVPYGILPDQREKLSGAFREAVETCDMVLISGGSSVGTRDLTCGILEEAGRVLFHGLSMKPGKPTIFGLAKRAGEETERIPVFGLPGHPGAAFFVAEIFIRPILRQLSGNSPLRTVSARLCENISANHGRAQYMAVKLETGADSERLARVIHTKSGLITSIAGSDGYICIPRDTEGLSAGTDVTVYLFE